MTNDCGDLAFPKLCLVLCYPAKMKKCNQKEATGVVKNGKGVGGDIALHET